MPAVTVFHLHRSPRDLPFVFGRRPSGCHWLCQCSAEASANLDPCIHFTIDQRVLNSNSLRGPAREKYPTEHWHSQWHPKSHVGLRLKRAVDLYLRCSNWCPLARVRNLDSYERDAADPDRAGLPGDRLPVLQRLFGCQGGRTRWLAHHAGLSVSTTGRIITPRIAGCCSAITSRPLAAPVR